MQSSTTCDLPTPIWIAFAVLGFVLFWPLGLMILFYMMWSGKMKYCVGRMSGWKNTGFTRWGTPYEVPRHSGNMAFDEYREATLKRLDEERREFADFVKQLRRAKDQDEFDKFMSERAARQSKPSTSK